MYNVNCIGLFLSHANYVFKICVCGLLKHSQRFPRAKNRSFGWKKSPVRQREHGDGMMMLVMVLVKSVNYRRSGNWEIEIRRSIYKQTKNPWGLFTKPNLKQKGKDLETLCEGMIRNMLCFKTAKRTVKTNQNFIDGQCVRNTVLYWQSLMEIRRSYHESLIWDNTVMKDYIMW